MQSITNSEVYENVPYIPLGRKLWMFRVTDTFKIVAAEKINFKQLYMCRKITEGTKTLTEYALINVASQRQMGRETHFTNN
jgi:hypothetical protein